VDVIVDSSVWIDYLAGINVREVEVAAALGAIVLPPLVIAELLSGNNTLRERQLIGELLQDFNMHQTPLAHWMRVGELRRLLSARGLNVNIPDAHVAQCAMERDAILYSRDAIFPKIASHTTLRLGHLR
jgi:predicted nucleic acid-binding protein